MNGKPQVMVVDDDLSMCNFLRTFLAQRGYQAVTFGSAEEAVVVTTLAAFDVASVDMRTLLIVGSSTTRVIPANGGPPRVYTPRTYPAPR